MDKEFLESFGLEAAVIEKILDAKNTELSKFKLDSYVERALDRKSVV